MTLPPINAMPIRFGLIGAGRIARKRLAPALHAAHGVAFVAAASRDLARAEALGADRSYSDYERLIADPEIDVVVVTTHNGLHRELSVAAMRAGKHVLCEKPLGLNAAEAAEMLQVARETGRHLVEAFMYRYHPQWDIVREHLSGGAIGELRSVEASFCFRLAEDEPTRLRAEWGGGALMDVGCYCVNVARSLLGDTPSGVIAHASFDRKTGVDRSLQGLLEYDAGRSAVINCSFDAGLHQQVVLVGTAGVLELSQPFKTTDLGGVAVVVPELILRTTSRAQRMVAPAANGYQLEIEDLAVAVATGAAPRLPPEEGLLNARIIDRLLADARERR